MKLIGKISLLLVVDGRGVYGAVWFGFERKSHPNRKIKKHAVCVTPTADEGRGVVTGAQGTPMSGSRQLLEEPNHI
ncbi:hypothetical protein MTR_3g082090 [Medicago truncatula]|uniref:Transmembrane protein n=1 Tax=Medicago truncatula TaxID=3880 RepID=G7J828_MEDTR|nr:hypothetical protein MTR_3g082090 [Medicago truncatula]